MRSIILGVCCVVCFAQGFATTPSRAEDWAWISSQDGEFHNIEGYLRTHGYDGSDIQYGGDLNDAWQNLQSGDSFTIICHGDSLTVEAGDGFRETSYVGGGLFLNEDEYAGFADDEQGTGTNPPCVMTPKVLPPHMVSGVSVMLLACYGADDPYIVQGDRPWPNGRSCVSTLQDILDGLGPQNTVSGVHGRYNYRICPRWNFTVGHGPNDNSPEWRAFEAALNQTFPPTWEDRFDTTDYDDHDDVVQVIQTFCAGYNESHQGEHYNLLQIDGYELVVPPGLSSRDRDEEVYCGELTNEGVAGWCDAPPTPAERSTWGRIKSMFR